MTKVSLWKDGAEWDQYVAGHPMSSNYHRWIWRSPIERSYGHDPHYLAATQGGRLRGILPLFRVQSTLFGRSLVSVPFFSYGGVVADDPDSRSALLQAAEQLAVDEKVRHVELRQNDLCDIDWQQVCAKVRMDVPLPPKVDELWKRLSTGQRNKVRKGQKSDLRAEWCGPDGIDTFYGVFATNMRNLGTPVYPKLWFHELHAADSENIRILNVWSADRAVASAFTVGHRGVLELPWSASLPDSRKQYSHVLLYWTILEWGIQNGFHTVDLGRCTIGGGTYEFKRHWVCEEKPMHWYYWLPAGACLPETRTDTKKFQLAIEAWKHLPLCVANRLGPYIVRALP